MSSTWSLWKWISILAYAVERIPSLWRGPSYRFLVDPTLFLEWNSIRACETPLLSLVRNSCLCTEISKQVFPEINLRVPNFCIHVIYIFPRPVRLFCCIAFFADRSWEYINCSQVHACRNRERGCAVSFLGICVLNFWYSASLWYSYHLPLVRNSCLISARFLTRTTCTL